VTLFMLPARAYVVSLASLLAGASVVHYAFGPEDLTIPQYGAPAASAASAAKVEKAKGAK
jgi:hypothetical protein